MSRRGRPTREAKASLKPPTEAHYTTLARACVSAILDGEQDVLVAFHYLTTLPDGFPKGVKKQEGKYNIHRIKANKLLTWLHEKGYTPITMELLRVEQIRLTKMIDNLERNL